MRILGVNICQRRSGKDLLDAGACLLENGEVVVAIAEERITRIKHDSSFENSISYCLKEANIKLEEVDLFVFSMCGCECPSTEYIQEVMHKYGVSIPDEKIVVCPSHHLSHAASAFFPSGFNESLILVADRDGSIISGNDTQPYANSVEHLSYYYGKDNEITLLERDETTFGDVGLGKGYSYVTSWLGFDGHNHAGKTMALASYGKSGALNPAHIFTYENNKIVCLLEPIESHKALSVRRLVYKSTGTDIGENCKDFYSQNAMDVARLVQDDLEDVVIRKLRYLRKKTGAKYLCFAGGVALNCKLNYEILKSGLFEGVFIQPAAGDTGQCLGNALYGYHMIRKKPRKYVMKNAYLGKRYSDEEIQLAVQKYKSMYKVLQPDNMYDYVAKKLQDGFIVGWFQGRSEFGPRALGNRSILANPGIPNMKDILNARVKFRESFRPFGASVLQEDAREYFDLSEKSPYMLLAPQVFPNKKNDIPAIVHVDNSCRIQTVNREDNERFYYLINAFKEISGIPMLINTSFNIQGEPIVESPTDAIECFINTNIDMLSIGDYVLIKNCGTED